MACVKLPVRQTVWQRKVLRYLRHYPPDLAKVLPLWGKECLLWKNSQSPGYRRHFIQQVYQQLIGVSPSAAEEAFYLDVWQRRNLSPRHILASFLMLPGRVEMALYGTTGIHSHHQARLKLVQTVLPSARRILDLGGSAADSALGSLLAMGYPHPVQELHIIDLPPEQRHYHRPQVQHATHFTANGVDITYHYRSMADLVDFPDQSFEMIWAGQSYEHISMADGEAVLRAAKRLLVPGGFLCLDTPNRLISALQVHEDWLHPEHQIEYPPAQLKARVQAHGFVVPEMGAVSPLPFSSQRQRFSRLELIESTGLGPSSDTGYSFYLIAKNGSGE